MSKTVFIIGAVWPESNSSAAGQNMAALLHHFAARGYQLHFASAAADSQHADSLETLSVTLHAIALNDSSFDQLLSQINPDIVIFDRFMVEEQFASRVRAICPSALHLLNTEDLHSLRHARHEAVKKGFDATKAQLNNAFAQREIAAILRSDLSLIISQAEYQLLTDYYQVPAKQLVLFPLQQDLTAENNPGYDEREHFITVGNFRHAPNWDAVLQLNQQIWPAIRKALPNAEMHIYGAYPPKKATQLDNPKQGFRVKGWVQDIDSVMTSARVCLAPLRFGAGIKGKLLTAMKHGTPSVTTSIGAEGICAPALWPGEVCSDNSTLINAAIKIYSQRETWQQAHQRCGVTTEHYQQQQTQSVNELFTKLDICLNNLADYRQSLFLQGLLWHHSLAAGKYMTQWIEAKNKNQP